MNIILTGFMGTGKSTVGKHVADKLHYRFVDTDEVIEEQHGPITGVFAVKGEDGFRAIEQDVARAVASQKQVVIATGGGTMLHPDNAHHLENAGPVYTLNASVDEILARLEEDGIESRPMFDDVDDPRARIEELLDERSETYGRYVQIETDGRTPDEIADEIVADLEERRGEYEARAAQRTVFGLPLTGGLIAGLATAAVFLALGLLLINSASPDRFNGVELADAFEVPASAPPADEYVQLESKLNTGDNVDRAVASRVRELPVVPGSAIHVGTNTSRLASRELYTFEADSGDIRFSCVGVLSVSSTNSAICLDPAGEPSVDAKATVFDDGVLHSATLRLAGDEFRWFTVATDDGRTILTGVDGTVAHLEWIDGEPLRFAAFDDGANEVWSFEVVAEEN